MTSKIVVLVACGSLREARKIGGVLVASRLAACANVLQTPMRSIYRWNGRVESAREILLILKTSRKRFRAVEREIRSLHRYDLPEIIALPILASSSAYLKWISESTEHSK
jgi:periplasmic divalent cation tolerance protein